MALKMKFDVGPFALVGGVPDRNKGRGGICPRRTVLDTILIEAAVASGVEFRENFSVEELIRDGDTVVGIKGRGGHDTKPVEERAKIVIGADGIYSFVAREVGVEDYNAIPPLATFYYSFWSGIDCQDVEQYASLVHQGAAYFPTNDGLTLIAAVWTSDQFEDVRQDIEGNFMAVHRQIPGSAERIESGHQEDRWWGIKGVPNYFRKPYGPGWALVGDAGYAKDPLTAQGISDSLIEAEQLADAIDAGFSGRQPLEQAMAELHQRRDARVMPLFQFTTQLARLEPPDEQMQQLFEALQANQDATNQFYAAITGSTPLPEFMNPENLGRIMATAGSPN
jgi:2-polyprenyl-6-methoxyphenol hydroxylase-like FAD-dependent oxidoreductase